MSTKAAALLLLVLLCCCASGAFGTFGTAASPLKAVWTGWSGFLNITQLDPSTGVEGGVLFASDQMMQLFPLSPAVDRRSQRLFVPLAGQFSGMVGVFDLSVPGKATFQKVIPTFGEMFYAIQYDSVRDTVWLVTANSPDGRPFVVSVDLASGKATNVTSLPDGFLPAIQGIGGGPALIDEKNRELVLSAMQHPNQNDMSYSLLKFNLDTHRFSSIPLPDLWPGAMAKDEKSGRVYALLHSSDRSQRLISFGTVDSTSGKIAVISKWNSTALVFVVGSLSAFDSASAQFYSVMGSGGGPPVALVTVSAKSGKVENAAYFNTAQPAGLFVF